jgi:DNA primase
MPIFSKESLETLRQRIDLVDVLSAHIDLKRSGASYKGLCPFHDEKTPSFTLQKGDHHYHCFGCGAHGDAIQFLMKHLKMGFGDAVESLAQRFNVSLQQVEYSDENKGPNKGALKAALDAACTFFQFILLHTPEGHEALHYLFKRGIDLDFVQQFRIGLAPRESGLLRKIMHAKFIKDEILADAGLIASGRDAGWRDFFQDRITFPICDATGVVIGFSARKYKEETFGGKYINTSETALFKKSKVLFGLHHSRRRIAKERKAIIVEGQIDALRLIAFGFNITVAGQGTAFGESHAKELIALGLNEVYLALDSDEAGRQAAFKIGDFFQKAGIETRVITLPLGEDPDSFLREKGPEAFLQLMKSSSDYLTFIVKLFSQKMNIESPAGKNELVQILSKQIRNWEHPLMVHESLRKLAHLIKVPESMLDVGHDYMPNVYIKKSGSIGLQTIDPDRILESDFLCCLFFAGNTYVDFVDIARENIKPEHLRIDVCRRLYQAYFECYEEKNTVGLLDIAIKMEDFEGQTLIGEIQQKKVNFEKAREHFQETIQKILIRNWMENCEEIRVKIQSAQCSEEETLKLVEEFGMLKRSRPMPSRI